MRGAVACPDCGFGLVDRGRDENRTANRWGCGSCAGEFLEYGWEDRSWELPQVNQVDSDGAVLEYAFDKFGGVKPVWFTGRRDKFTGSMLCSACGYAPAEDGEALLRYTPFSEESRPAGRYFLVCGPCFADLTRTGWVGADF